MQYGLHYNYNDSSLANITDEEDLAEAEAQEIVENETTSKPNARYISTDNLQQGGHVVVTRLFSI